jgi:ABC-type transport system involved in multi-copper enzyme maturation permease subunit
MAEITAAPVRPPNPRFGAVLRAIGGIAAIGVKELRGRMRGRRAFIILTIYLLLLGGFALMVEQIMEQNFQNPFAGASATAGPAIGQAIFAAVLFLMTLQVVFLAPSSTAGAISLEREKQTLELLVTTPISSFAIVIGKLLSALVYVFLLIAASIPLMAVVFVFGGVGPEDIVRGYIVLIVTALGLGSFGLLCSSLVKRTTASTAITIFGVLAITIGTVFLLVFWQAMGSFDATGNRRPGPLGIRTPYPLAWINPFLAQADVLCGTESTFGGGWCSIVQGLAPTANNGVIINNVGGGPVPMPAPVAIPEKGFAPGGAAIAVDDSGNPIANDDVAPIDQQFGARQDTLWPKTVAMWLAMSVFFILLSVQAVSPTRRWRLRRRGARSPAS